MHEYRIAFPSGSQTAIFCPAHFQSCNFEQLAQQSLKYSAHGLAGWKGLSNRSGGARRMLLSLGALAGLCVSLSKRKEDELPSEKLRRLSSPRHWDVALVPFREDFVPLSTPAETGLACPAPWAFPPSLCVLEPRTTKAPSVGHCGSRRYGHCRPSFANGLLGCRAQTHSAGYPWPSAHSVSTRMHSGPLAELACSLPAADLWQYDALLLPSSQLCCCPGTAARHDNGHIVFNGGQSCAGP